MSFGLMRFSNVRELNLHVHITIYSNGRIYHWRDIIKHV